MFNSELYHQFQYDVCGIITSLARELEVQVPLYVCFPLWKKNILQCIKILHQCFGIPTDYMMIHPRNGDMKVNLWIVIPLCLQQVAIQI